MGLYDGADKAIKEMNRRNLKAFDRLRVAKWDELNLIKQVDAVYDGSIRMAKKRYYEIAMDAFITALYETGMDPRKATEMGDDTITEDWVLEFLEIVDPVMLYAFLPEAYRKKQRLIEALSVAHDKGEEVSKALRLWTVQVAQFADNAVYQARLEAFRAAGVEYVRWVTQKDEKVCTDCEDLDEEIFAIDNVPPPQHPHCRCFIVPV